MKNKASKSGLLTLAVIAFVFVAFRFGGWLVGTFVSFLLLLAVVIWQWPNLLTLFGQRAYANGNNTKALKYLKAGHEHSRAKADNSSAYAYILLRCGRVEEAKVAANYALMNKRIGENEKNKIRQILSLICYKNGEYAEATRIMEQIFETYKSSAVYGTLGYYKILAGSADARAFNAEAYAYNSEDKIIIDNMVLLYLQDGQYERARELSAKSIEAGNKGIEIFYHAAQAEEALGSFEKALEYYRMARSCTRSFMTTVPEVEIDSAIERLEEKI